MSIQVHFLIPTTHAGELELGRVECATMDYARVVIKAWKQQHPTFSQKMVYEIEERDEKGNLHWRILG